MTIVIHPDVTGYAPAEEAWLAYDDDLYDGAEDSRTRGLVGRGATADEAIADLLELLKDWYEERWEREIGRAEYREER